MSSTEIYHRIPKPVIGGGNHLTAAVLTETMILECGVGGCASCLDSNTSINGFRMAGTRSDARYDAVPRTLGIVSY